MPTPHGSPAFKSPEGEAAYRTAYNGALMLWPVPYEQHTVASRFGITHVVVSGPRQAPPLVLLHGYCSTLTMWSPNVADFSKDYRVYAVDVMGQPGKSVPAEPIRSAADYVKWLSATLDALRLDCVSLAGMSDGGWLALSYALAEPERVQSLVLLAPTASVLPVSAQFSARRMAMSRWPRRFVVTSFIQWLGFDTSRNPLDESSDAVELLYLGVKHFQPLRDTLDVATTLFSDQQLRALRAPTLLLIGERDVTCDPAKSIARADRLIPDLECALLPGAGHEMCASRPSIVNARVLEFLRARRFATSERHVA